MTRLPNRSLRDTHETQLNLIVQHRISTRRVVVHCDRAGERVLPVRDVLVLPRPVSAVDHGVMEEERWV